MTQAATDEIAEAERKVLDAVELGQPVFDGLDSLLPESIPDAVRTVEDAVLAAQTDLDKCSSSIVAKKQTMGTGDAALKALQTQFKTLLSRLAKGRRTCAELKEKSRKAKEKVEHDSKKNGSKDS